MSCWGIDETPIGAHGGGTIAVDGNAKAVIRDQLKTWS
jgi:hypothetical protein